MTRDRNGGLGEAERAVDNREGLDHTTQKHSKPGITG